jgi:hypothetical protein
VEGRCLTQGGLLVSRPRRVQGTRAARRGRALSVLVSCGKGASRGIGSRATPCGRLLPADAEPHAAEVLLRPVHVLRVCRFQDDEPLAIAAWAVNGERQPRPDDRKTQNAYDDTDALTFERTVLRGLRDLPVDQWAGVVSVQAVARWGSTVDIPAMGRRLVG